MINVKNSMFFNSIFLLAASIHVNAVEYIIGKTGDFCNTSVLTLSQCRAYAEKIDTPIDIDSRSDIHPGCSLTENLVNFNQNYESVAALANYRPVCSTAENAGAGGPHYYGFGKHFFKWHGNRDVILLKTPHFSDRDPGIEVHIRTKMKKKWSVIDIIAIMIGDNIAQITGKNGKLVFDGEEMESVETELVSVVKNFSGQHKDCVVYDFIFGDDKRINIKACTKLQTIYLTFNGNFPRGTIGLLGSPHNPGLITRDGRNMTGYDMNLYAESWQVLDSDPHIINHYRIASSQPNRKSRIRANHKKRVHAQSMAEAGFFIAAVCLISVSIKISL